MSMLPAGDPKCKHVWPKFWREWEQYGDYKVCEKCGKWKWANWVIQAAKKQELERTTCQHRCPVHCPKKED